MKIGIITQPLHTNYGGILQNYALQQVLIKMGHEVITIDQKSLEPSFFHSLRAILIAFVRNTFCGQKIKYPLSRNERKQIALKVTSFIDNYIQRTPKMSSYQEMKTIVAELKLDICIVGSDQVWRPIYNIRYQNSFLDFLKGDHYRRIAYAASFGVDTWEFNERQTLFTKEYIKKFNAVSVREQSAVDLCKKYWGVDAQLVPDPTFLLNQSDYEMLVKNENEPECPKGILTYVLDKSDMKTQIINRISQNLQLPVFSVTKGNDRLSECPSVTHWLRGFMDSTFVICDSFHGTVFSIIFNKPFIVLSNSRRGNTRFYSLLEYFGLEDRMVSIDDYSVFKQPIDWDIVNNRKEVFVQRGVEFLSNILQK